MIFVCFFCPCQNQGTFGKLQPCSTSNGTWTTTRSVPRPGRFQPTTPRDDLPPTSIEVLKRCQVWCWRWNLCHLELQQHIWYFWNLELKLLSNNCVLESNIRCPKKWFPQKVVTCFLLFVFGCTIMISIMASEKTWGFIIKCLQPWRISPNLWSLRVLASWMKISADGLFGCVVKNELTKSPDGESH